MSTEITPYRDLTLNVLNPKERSLWQRLYFWWKRFGFEVNFTANDHNKLEVVWGWPQSSDRNYQKFTFTNKITFTEFVQWLEISDESFDLQMSSVDAISEKETVTTIKSWAIEPLYKATKQYLLSWDNRLWSVKK